MKYLKIFITFVIIVEIVFFTILLRGSYLNPERKTISYISRMYPPDLSELSEDYRAWKFISNFPFRKHNIVPFDPNGIVNLSIDGNYLYSDSVYIDSLILLLNNLVSSFQLQWGSGDQKSYSIMIKFLTDFSEFEVIEENIAHSKSVKPLSKNRGPKIDVVQIDPKPKPLQIIQSTFKKGGKGKWLYVNLPDSLSLTERHKYVRSVIIRDLFNLKLDKSFHITYAFPSNALVTIEDWRTSEFTDTDKHILQRMYSKNRWLKLFVKYPLLFLDYAKKEYESLSETLYMLNCFLVICLYFLYLIKRGVFRYQVENWLKFNKKACFIGLSLVLFSVFQELYLQYPYGNSFFHEFHSALLFYLIQMVLILALSNVIFLTDQAINKLKIDQSSNLLLKIVSSFLIASLAIILLYFRKNSNYLFLAEWIIFIFLLLGSRAVFMFHNFLVENAVKEKDLELAQLKAVQQQSELQAIHSRINPHFLYNSLNSIASLAGISPEKTEKMAMALSKFFRFAINRNNEEFIKIKDELEIVETYLEIEKIRFGDKLEFSIYCENDLLEIPIPRFIIQPLAENAIKHGVSSIMDKGKLTIMIKKEINKIKIQVSDNGNDFPEEPLYGYGLQSIYDKLQLYYKGEATIDIIKQPEKAIILTIPYTIKKAN